jgi:hypothetical protein
MNRSLLIGVGLTLCAFSNAQVFTLQQFAHTSYVNKQPGQIVVMNENWRNHVEYVGSGSGYDCTYIYNLRNNTVTCFERDSLGRLVEDSFFTRDIQIISSGDNFFYVFNPSISKFSLFFFDDWKVPHLLVENLDGKGYFMKGDDMVVQITPN